MLDRRCSSNWKPTRGRSEMWVSPNHPNPPRQNEPPPDDGQELTTVRRSDGHELRLRLKSYQGRPYVSVQLWCDRPGDGCWPVKGRSVTFRLNELGAIIDALQGAVGAAGDLDRQRHPVREGHRDTMEAGPVC